jgi:hypothetical protein
VREKMVKNTNPPKEVTLFFLLRPGLGEFVFDEANNDGDDPPPILIFFL